MIAGIDFPSFFGSDLFSSRRSGTNGVGNPYDPESLLTGGESAKGMTYANSRRDWISETDYRAAVAGFVPTDALVQLAPRVRVDSPAPTCSIPPTPLGMAEKVIATFPGGFTLVDRSSAGLRLRHGPWVEWPILRPLTNELIWAQYSFNQESNGPDPIPSEITTRVRDILLARSLRKAS
jgi:hypothetical protein